MWANPTGGVVASGTASISSAGTTTTINQSTAQAIINWQQFSIANNEATKFFVPTAASVTLNRVLGGNPSAIYGTLSSNGQLILINPSGIVVGPSGRIDTAGFIGSTLAITDDDFLKGNLHFSGDGSATVDNEGTIEATGGDVYLIGGQVTNGGSISAPQGTAGLAAGNDILFEQAGDQHLYVQATPLDATRAVGVSNSGTIHAAAAELKAAGGNAYALAINNTGQITATGFKKIGGQVYLTADGADIDNSGTIVAHNANGSGGTIVLNGYGTSSKGTVLNSGKLLATGKKKGKTGGTVEVLGNQVGITGFGLVDVSGDAGGGTALIGGDEHGANAAIPDADQTYLGPDATIKADAFTLGNGGKVILWGNETTQAYGAISVRGGAQGGNGGFVETSAKTLDAQTVPNLSAPKGTGGTWLLDPADITISDTADTTLNAPFTLGSDSSYSINQSDLLMTLESGDVTLDAGTGSGAVSDGGTITWTQSSAAFDIDLSAAHTLTLNAPGNILLNGVTINTTGTAGLNLVLNSNLSTAGSIEVLESNIALNGGSFTANGQGQVSQSQYQNNSGFYLESSTLDAQGGSISITGYAGYGNNNGSTDAGDGVFFNNTGQGKVLVTTSGTGNITIKGYSSQDITSSQGFTGVGIQGGGSDASSSTTVSVASGLLDIEGYVTSGTADSSTNYDSITGVNIDGGAQIEATAAGGSVTLVGNVSGSTVDVENSPNSIGSTGVNIDSYDSGSTPTTVSVVGSTGANDGVHGVLSITGTGGTVDTTYSTQTDSDNNSSLPYTEGVKIGEGAVVSATGANAAINITGTGGAITLSQIVIEDDSDNSTTTGNYTGSSQGVEIDGSTVSIIGTGGALTVLGYGGAVNAGYGNNAGDADSEGVGLDGDEGTEVVSVADGGSISLTGYGGALDNSNAALVTGKNMPSTQGVSVDAGVELEAAGSTTISITGTGGNINSGSNSDGDAIGVNIGSGDGAHDQPTLVSSVTGDITIIGYGGETPSLGLGAEAHGFNSHLTTIESTGGGNISFTGVGGTGYTGGGTVSGNSVPDSGTALIDDVLVTTNNSTTGTVPGSITLVGTGDSYSTGVVVEELPADDTVLDSKPALPVIEAGGALTIYALGGTGEYINGTITAQSATFGAESTYSQPIDAVVSNAIFIDSDPTITSGHLDITNATVTLTGGTGGSFIAYGAGYTGFSGTNGNPDGIDVTDSTINGAGGDVTLTGTGGYVSYSGDDDENTTSYAGAPVSISNDSAGSTLIETSSSGNITITGTNDTSVTSTNGLVGVIIYGTTTDELSTKLAVADGTLSVTGKVLSGTADGTAEYGADLSGLNIENATVTATGNGSITLDGDVSGATSTVSGTNFSFASGTEINENAVISAQGDGTITIDGTGGSIDASGYTGDSQDAFSVGVQVYGQSQVIGAGGSTISIDGTQESGATAVDADMIGTLINHGSLVEINGTGGEISLTGTTTGTTATSSAEGNFTTGLEIDSLFNDGQGTGSQITEVSIDANGTLVLNGTGGTVDATANSNNEDDQASSVGIYIDGGSEIIANSGAGVTITGTGGAATTASVEPTGFAGASAGVVFDDASVRFAGDNTVVITGTGGSVDDGTNVASNTSNPAQSVGVIFEYDGSNSLVSVGDGGSLTVYGYGGAVDTTNGSASAVGDTFPGTAGIQVNSDVEAAGDATITLNGTGGAIETDNETIPTVGVSFGIGIGDDNHDVQVSSQTGDITITGMAENAPNLGIGVLLHDFNGNELLLKSTSGDITITGTGGSGNSGAGSFTGFFEPNYGVLALGHVELTTTNGGTVAITGTDGSSDLNGAGVAFLTTSDTSVDDDSIEPDLNASGAVTLNALSGGGILLATTTIEAPSLTVGDANTSDDITSVTSGPVRIYGSDLETTGDLTVYGEGGGSGSTLTAAVDINGSTLNADGGDVDIFETGGSSNNLGVEVENGSTVETSGGGTIAITGEVSNLDAQGLDVAGVVIDDSTIQSVTGSITLNGTVSNSSTSNGDGLQGAELEDGSGVTSTMGAISITGSVYSGGTSAPVTGLFISQTSIEATQIGGSITLVGNTLGAIALDASNTGLSLYNDNSESDYLVSTLDGPGISITGTSGGVSLDSGATGTYVTYGASIGATISTTGTAPITITGNGGAITGVTYKATELQSTGADFFNESGVAEKISTTGGLITIKGYGGTSPNSGFGVFLYGFAGSPYDVQSTSGNIQITGVAGGSPSPESEGASTYYEPNIGVGLADDVNLSSTNGSITVTGTGTALADIGSWDGSGIGIQINSFAGYNDYAGSADSEPATPQLSAGGTISLLSLLGTVELGEYAQIAGSPISGNIIVSTPGEPDLSYVDNLAGTVTLNGGNFAVETQNPLTVQTGTGTEPSAVDIFDSASVTLGSISTPSLYVESDNGTVTQTGPIDTGFFSGYATSITLMNPGNNIAQLGEVTSGGALSIYTDPGLLLNNEVQSDGPLLLESIGGGITLNQNASVVDTGSGNVVLVTNEAFVNGSNDGGSAVEAEDGYTDIYAGDSTNTNLGGITTAFTQYNTSYPSGLGSTGNGLFFAGNGTNTGTGGTGTGGTGTGGTGTGGTGTGGTGTGGTGTGGGPGSPPVVGAPIQTPPGDGAPGGDTSGDGITGVTGGGGQLPPFTFVSGSGDVNQTGSQTGGLAFASGGSGQVGSGDAAQLNNGQMNNVSNPHASGALDDALSGAVHETLEDALTSVGAFADSMTYGDTSGDNTPGDDNDKDKGKGGNTNNEQVIGPGGVVEMGGNGVHQIPPGSAPPQLQNALGNGVLQGLQPAGH